jgi:hypothetical protein
MAYFKRGKRSGIWTRAGARGGFVLEGRKRSGASGWDAFAGSNVGRPAAFVFLGRAMIQFSRLPGEGLLVQLLEERDTPPAAGAGAAAFG